MGLEDQIAEEKRKLRKAEELLALSRENEDQKRSAQKKVEEKKKEIEALELQLKQTPKNPGIVVLPQTLNEKNIDLANLEVIKKNYDAVLGKDHGYTVAKHPQKGVNGFVLKDKPGNSAVEVIYNHEKQAIMIGVESTGNDQQDAKLLVASMMALIGTKPGEPVVAEMFNMLEEADSFAQCSKALKNEIKKEFERQAKPENNLELSAGGQMLKM